MKTDHRFTLEPYRGPATRYTCPQCGKPRCFARYVDTRNDELLPEAYGRCNREDRCGYQLGPYDRSHTGVSYADEVYERENKQRAYQHTAKAAPHRSMPWPQQPTPRNPIHNFPDEVFQGSLTHYERNQFTRLLADRFGAGEARDLIDRFRIGTSSYWPGATVFWLIDEQNRVRSGQVVLFESDGHTAKRAGYDGSLKRCTSWVHSALTRRYQHQQKPLPDWLSRYNEQADKAPCLFGLNQLESAPADKPCAITEAPKTAVFCSGYFPDFVWLAVLGKSYLNAERLAPLRGRHIVLFPDLGAFTDWQQRAEQLTAKGFSVVVSDYLEQMAVESEKAKGLDLADYLLEQWAGYPPSWDQLTGQPDPRLLRMAQQNPDLGTLIETLHLEAYQVKTLTL